MMWWWNGAWGPWAMGIGMLIMLAFWGLVIWGIVYAVRAATAPRSGSGSERSALQILDERFARGEIDEEEYRARRAALTA